MTPEDPVVVAIALSLYGFNVSPQLRAMALWQHFAGDCMELRDLVEVLAQRGAFLATELPFPSAEVYVAQTLARYGAEARERVRLNRRGFQADPGGAS